MRGRVSDWKDERGFGFIEPDAGGERVFLHVSGMARGAARPVVGDIVSYETTRSPDGKLRAIGVTPVGGIPAPNGPGRKRAVLSITALLVFPLLWWLVTLEHLPRQVLWAYAGMSVITFAIYGLDKRAARRGARRTPENTLQLAALCGGWPGALLAQQVFRHKSSKRPFQIVFWMMVVLNCAAVGLLLSPGGAVLLRQLLQA